MLLNILELAKITFKGGLRDKVFLTLLAVSLLCFIIVVPAVSSLSMRQVREVATSLSLSVISLVMFVITIFLGVTLVYRDVERRFALSILSMPLTREAYVIGKFLGLAAIIGAGIIILSACSVIGIAIAAYVYHSSLPMMWENFAAAVLCEFLTLVIIASVSILFSSFSTNLFLPLFATLGVYVIGNVSQTVMDYVQSTYGGELPLSSVILSKAAYYVFPNLSALDIKFNAIYSIPLRLSQILAILAYALLYMVIVLGFSVLVFRKREVG